MALLGLNISLNKIKSSFTKILLPLAGIGLLFSSPLAYATYPDITGTWPGTASGADFSCSSPADDGPFSDTLTVVISNQSGGVSM